MNDGRRLWVVPELEGCRRCVFLTASNEHCERMFIYIGGNCKLKKVIVIDPAFAAAYAGDMVAKKLSAT